METDGRAALDEQTRKDVASAAFACRVRARTHEATIEEHPIANDCNEPHIRERIAYWYALSDRLLALAGDAP